MIGGSDAGPCPQMSVAPPLQPVLRDTAVYPPLIESQRGPCSRQAFQRNFVHIRINPDDNIAYFHHREYVIHGPTACRTQRHVQCSACPQLMMTANSDHRVKPGVCGRRNRERNVSYSCFRRLTGEPTSSISPQLVGPG
jgi:hypothetical protein